MTTRHSESWFVFVPSMGYENLFQKQSLLVFYILGVLLAQGQLVAAIWIIILVILLCLYLNHIKDKKIVSVSERNL